MSGKRAEAGPPLASPSSPKVVKAAIIPSGGEEEEEQSAAAGRATRRAECEANGLTAATFLRSGNSLAVLHLGPTLLLVALAWALVLLPPQESTRQIAARLSPLSLGVVPKTWTRILPPVAKTRASAWDLANSHGTLETLLAQNAGAERLRAALAVAGERLESCLGGGGGGGGGGGVALPSAADKPKARAKAVVQLLERIRVDTVDDERERGMANWLRRAFSLVNLVWLGSIVGIVISVGPFLATTVQSLTDLLRLFWQRAASHAWRPLLYAAVAGAFATASLPDASHDVRVYTALLAASLLYAAFLFTLSQLAHCGALAETDSGSTATQALGWLLFTPLAILTRSELLAFLSSAWLFSVLGFGTWSVYGGYAIGFKSRDSLERCGAASAVIVIVDVALAVPASGSNPVLQLFSSGMQCFGATAGLIALLIKSSRWDSDRSFGPAPLISAIALGVTLGTILPQLLCLRNTCLVFAYLALLDFASFSATKWSGWAGLLVTSVALYVGALALHARPELLQALYSRAPL